MDAATLRAWRHARGLSRRAAAEMLGINERTLEDLDFGRSPGSALWETLGKVTEMLDRIDDSRGLTLIERAYNPSDLGRVEIQNLGRWLDGIINKRIVFRLETPKDVFFLVRCAVETPNELSADQQHRLACWFKFDLMAGAA